jgi:HEAT repeat protein
MNAISKELIKKILLSAIAFILYMLTMISVIDATSLFLSELGASKYPIALVIISVLVILNSVISSVISSRVMPDKLFAGVLLFFFVNFFILSFIPTGNSLHLFYYTILTGFMIYLQEIALINYTNSLLTPLQAKSYLPLIYSFMSVGVIVGALLAEPYSHLPDDLKISWLPMLQLAILVIIVVVTSRLFRREIILNFYDAPKEKIYQNVKDSFSFLRNRGQLYTYLAIAIFLFVGLQCTLDFKMKTVLSMTFSQAKLTEILGIIFLLRSGLSWVLSAFFAKALLFRFGVSNLLIFFPISMFAVTGIALATDMHYISVIAMFTVYSISHFVYFAICAAQVMSIVPKDKQQAVYFLLRGLLFALSLLFFSLVLLIYSYDITLEPLLNTITIVVILAVLLYLVIKVKDIYHEELKNNLYKDDEYLRDRSIELLAEKVTKDRDEFHLRRLLNMPTINPNTKSKVLLSLGIIGNYQTIVDLAKFILSNQDSRLKSEAIQAINMIIQKKRDLDKYPVSRHFLLETYEKVLLSDDPLYVKMEIISSLRYFNLDDVIKYLKEHLLSENVLIKTNAIKTLSTFNDRGIIPYIEPFLNSKDYSVVGTTIAALWQFEDMRTVLIPKIGEMLSKKSIAAISNALYLLSFVGLDWERNYILKQLNHKNAHIRLQALLTLIKIGEIDRIDDLISKMLWLAQRGEQEELEFIFSRYRHFPPSTKKLLMRKIQQLKESEAQEFYKAFKSSRYVFKWEEGELSKNVGF